MRFYVVAQAVIPDDMEFSPEQQAHVAHEVLHTLTSHLGQGFIQWETLSHESEAESISFISELSKTQ